MSRCAEAERGLGSTRQEFHLAISLFDNRHKIHIIFSQSPLLASGGGDIDYISSRHPFETSLETSLQPKSVRRCAIKAKHFYSGGGAPFGVVPLMVLRFTHGVTRKNGEWVFNFYLNLYTVFRLSVYLLGGEEWGRDFFTHVRERLPAASPSPLLPRVDDSYSYPSYVPRLPSHTQVRTRWRRSRTAHRRNLPEIFCGGFAKFRRADKRLSLGGAMG